MHKIANYNLCQIIFKRNFDGMHNLCVKLYAQMFEK
jgi:hypothetical protein